MSQENSFFTSSIGRKVLMSVTGLMLFGFIFTHWLGNLYLLVGADAFNNYAYTLTSNKLIYLAEAGLLAIFLVHVFLAVKLSNENRAARPEKYVVRNNLGESSVSSRSMLKTGALILAFIVVHIKSFKFGAHKIVEVHGVKMHDVYSTVVTNFQSIGYSVMYILAMIVLGIHLAHAFKSACQTLGLNHSKYTPKIKKMSICIGVFFTLGFSMYPLFVLTGCIKLAKISIGAE